ncbi:hypothetical protein CCR75_009577 [Bremia lactucae]|uniref:GPI inositol-deacylase n=1 Tax=Bremia lactucae TaxID=4779 RepID=A0A976IJM9_BRELC|nr:hypothetical protein CCR75_009577 [Bremia lactucae]
MTASQLLLPLLAFSSVLLTALYVFDEVATRKYVSACEMTWSWPVFSPVKWRSTPSHDKYQFYRVDMKSARNSLSGVPVLFVPGHMGSYKQARSLSRHLWDTNETLFDIFALDLNDEPTGLNGNYITDQALYLNDVVRAILKEYKRQHIKSEKQLNSPESIVIVAHSMGGVVARTAELLPNYKKRSIQHVVALGVPYNNPPYPFDVEMSAIYDRMHSEKGKDDNVVYISIAGGHKDPLVQPHLTCVDKMADSTQAFEVLTSAIPQVQTTVDHFCLLWCHQLLKVVAESLYKSVDLDTRDFLRNPIKRLTVAKETLLGGASGDDDEVMNANVLKNRMYVQDGYYPGEYSGYALLLPQFVSHLLRAKFMTVFVIIYALILHIFSAQVARWQTRFKLQPTALLEDLGQDTFPSLISMLNLAALTPAFIKNVVYALGKLNVGVYKYVSMGAAGFTVAAVVIYFGFDEVLSIGQLFNSLTARVAAEVISLYAYALGLLYALTKLFSLLQRFVLAPIVSNLNKVTTGLKLRSWMIIIIVHFVVQLVGRIKGPSSMDFINMLGLLVVASFIVFVLHLLALGGNIEGPSDQQHMQHSVFALLLLSIFPWVGKVVYFLGIAQSPLSELSNNLLIEGGSCVVFLSMFTYLISLSLDCMIPLPPTAFFGATSDQDSALVYENSSKKSSSCEKITAENCPKCIFEDGGPGSIMIEFTTRATRQVVAAKSGDVVYVGPTFRVVACDCVYRFKNLRDFCGFCIRSCRICGGGNVNFQEAAKYKDFLQDNKVESVMHALVPIIFQMSAAIQATYGLYRAYLSYYFTIVCVLALLFYHVVLRHPIEAKRIKNKQHKKAKKRK